jgi:Tol biopolymer transport system component
VQARRGDDTHLALVPSDGGAPEMLVSEPGQTWAGAFSPDGDKVAFAGERDRSWNVYTVSRRTKQVAKLTDFGEKGTAYARYPAWSPLGDRIAFEYAETAGNVWLVDLPK